MSAPYFDSNEHADDPAGDLCDRIIVQDGLGDRLSRIATKLDENAMDVNLDAVTVLLDVVEAALHEMEGHFGNQVPLPAHIVPLPTGKAARDAANELLRFEPGQHMAAWNHIIRLARA
jgi:hypothetical protein